MGIGKAKNNPCGHRNKSKNTMRSKRSYKKIDSKKGVDRIGICCVFFCHDGKGKILMHKRSRSCRDERGRWDCGSGSMEFGETFEECVRREIKEEYGIKPRALKLCGVTNVIRKNGREKTHWIAVIFAAKVNSKNVKTSEPHKIKEIRWFSINKLPKPLHSMLKKHLATVRWAVKI